MREFIVGHSVNRVVHDQARYPFDDAPASAVGEQQPAFFEREIPPRDQLVALDERQWIVFTITTGAPEP